jgi:heme-degrading monooxygenase HmoA
LWARWWGGACNDRGMWIVVWTYTVAPQNRSEFEVAYGPDGDWVQLFSEGWGFEGSELFATGEGGHYLTIDRWESQAAAEAFMRTHGNAYRALDVGLAHLVDSEMMVFSGARTGEDAFP